ncbi:EPIDERMAL PATTERNING FACTOR-like protein 9 isoform X1 [Phalaenopsis equestris]|uniref:EPIDERMAL PATTERNING FACTOR-like protein 9 isoform X1 n=1 Tax=Phalaenopsis equestris TaxID=78828 RepID=UPI0009E232BC|nr:EPIDERMAL PATTERNING FACTOR-like protein 9 isoform X1 [Phalaenopsis equestris]
MTIKTPSSLSSFLFLFLLLSSSDLVSSSNSSAINNGIQAKHKKSTIQAQIRDSLRLKEKRGGTERRLMIGSMAPHCTYNECRGCRFKCQAEQVPVDTNDPMNSAYRYRCVCHR